LGAAAQLPGNIGALSGTDVDAGSPQVRSLRNIVADLARGVM